MMFYFLVIGRPCMNLVIILRNSENQTPPQIIICSNGKQLFTSRKLSPVLGQNNLVIFGNLLD
ncbi:hypothetical protein ADN01_01870 [Levilinea saccharolytica]|uniref:Uncharacterized protein n=1 Tax=Levilinea saccharolytica TaxID=229921 RepID=A0A0P6YC33_9CHLR|nr:hypothetical protein ADN01_01870 [Levilinea saccharolytica]